MIDSGGQTRRVHLLDGTYELFRHHFGQPPRSSNDGMEIGATYGVINSVIAMFRDEGVTHLGVATDHVIESFRNTLWPTYKNGDAVAPELKAQFPLLEDALVALGVVVWPMVELEADDALASAAATACADDRVDQVVICTPDKDLAQCVVGSRVVQLDRRRGITTNHDGVVAKFGVEPESIPDYLGLVGDSADGFPGLHGWGKTSAAAVLSHYRHIEHIPQSVRDWDSATRKRVRSAPLLAQVLSERWDDAVLFRDLATLRRDNQLLAGGVMSLAWKGPTPGFSTIAARFRDPGMMQRAAALAEATSSRI